MPLEGIHVDDKLQFVEAPVEIMEREIKRLKRSRIPLVKVRWNSRRGPELTWECEDSFKKKYPQLFTNRDSSSTTRPHSRDTTPQFASKYYKPVAPLSSDYVSGPEHPPSPDYIPGPEHPLSPVEVPYVPEPEYPKYLVPSDAEAPLKDQPLPIDASPTALSPGYPSDDNDDADDEEKETSDNEEEEEHLAPADPSVIPVVDPVPSAGDTEAVEAEVPVPAHG
ncbi:hypothetical protein Tco_1350035 [Tanacetum coccineum]